MIPLFETLRRGRFALLPVLVLTLAAGLGLFGCSADSSSPTAPSIGNESDLTRAPGASAPAGGSSVGGASNDRASASGASAVASPAPLAVPKTGRVISVTKALKPLTGGNITAGRFTLVVPPLALRANANITVVDASGAQGFVQCELYPEGLTFRLPVVLQTRMSDLASPLLYHTYWIQNPGSSSESWIDLGGGILPSGLGLAAPLSHFSVYRPGKYGW